jgi:hypothetical protein
MPTSADSGQPVLQAIYIPPDLVQSRIDPGLLPVFAQGEHRDRRVISFSVCYESSCGNLLMAESYLFSNCLLHARIDSSRPEQWCSSSNSPPTIVCHAQFQYSDRLLTQAANKFANQNSPIRLLLPVGDTQAGAVFAFHGQEAWPFS